VLAVLKTYDMSQKISCLARIRPGESKSNYGLLGSVHILVTIERIADRLPVGITWPVAFFDPVSEKLIQRFDGDEECYQNNLVLASEKLKATRLALELYVSGIEVTTKDFKKRFSQFASRDDFVDYMISKREQLYTSGEVVEGTYKKYLTVIHRVQDFQSGKTGEYLKQDLWKFNTMTFNQVKSFELWMINRKGWAHNTMVGTIKIIHKFLTCAKKDGIVFKNPMEDYPIPSFSNGIREALDLKELSALKKFYLKGGFEDYEKDVLERYLISCFTGLRKSDIEQLDTRIHIRNQRLCLKMFKTRKYDKMVEFKLPKFVLDIIGKRRGRLYLPLESSPVNKTLRRLINRLTLENSLIEEITIEKYIKLCSGRDTFATNFLRLGGMIIVLKDILGHSSIKMTEIYLKMVSEDGDITMDQFDNI
jgi:integrase/recombinase XerD